MNKIQLVAPPIIASVSFLFIDLAGVLIDTVVASKNASNVWIGTVSPSLPKGAYNVVGTSNGIPLGSESIVWDGSNVLSTTEMIERINELHLLMGLNGSKPLTVSPTRRTVANGSEIDQTIQNSNGVVTVTRVT